MENVNPSILLVEDEPNLGSVLRDYLGAKGYDTKLCTNGQEGFDTFVSGRFDLCILDIMLPVKDGYTLAKEIRQADARVPIIFLTAKSLPEDRILGFKAGGDDYLTKPFNMEELLMRVKAVLKRTAGLPGVSDKDEHFVLGDFAFDSKMQTLRYKEGDLKKLTAKESELLRLLALNYNTTLDRSLALKTIWGDDSYFNARSMDVYITKLRKYLQEDGRLEILNVHGKGFKLLMNA
jgi:DNA-binding response OmpR family regulator